MHEDLCRLTSTSPGPGKKTQRCLSISQTIFCNCMVEDLSPQQVNTSISTVGLPSRNWNDSSYPWQVAILSMPCMQDASIRWHHLGAVVVHVRGIPRNDESTRKCYPPACNMLLHHVNARRERLWHEIGHRQRESPNFIAFAGFSDAHRVQVTTTTLKGVFP